MDFDGKVLWKKKIETKVKAISSTVLLSIPEDEISKVGPDPERTFITLRWRRELL